MYPERAADGEDIYYYITIYNENYEQPPRPDHVDNTDITSGIYKYSDGPETSKDLGDLRHNATILFSGPAVGAALEAQKLLAEHHDVSAELWSVTSYKRLRADALGCERRNRLEQTDPAVMPLVTRRLADSEGPIVAVSDWMTLVPDQIARWTPRPLHVLGTDGFGRSDTREALRRFFEVDAAHLVVAVLSALAEDGLVSREDVVAAISRYGIDPDRPDPSHPDAVA
jgi:pyruvate dehydrogenase E1 component